LGEYAANLNLTTATVATSYFIRTRGKRRYELSNHLGNVQVVVSDRKIPIPEATNTTISYFTADIVSATDYYAFGAVMPDRSFNAVGYRFGFNGKENDNEVKGNGNQQDYGMRIYDPRIGRFLSTDPLTNKYPFYTPFQFAGDDPINFVDVDGGERGYSKQQMDAVVWQARQDPNMYYTDGRGETAYKNLEADRWIYLSTSVNGTRYFEKPIGDGKWEEFEPTDARQEAEWTEINKNTMSHLQGTAKGLSAFGVKLEQTIYVAAIMGTGGAASAALGVELFATEVAVGSAIADVTIQLAVNKGDINKVNWASVGANLILKNPFSAAFAGAAFEVTAENGTKNSILGDKSGGQLLTETALGTGGNMLGSSLGKIPVLADLPVSTAGQKVAQQADSYIWNSVSNTGPWAAQKLLEGVKVNSNNNQNNNSNNNNGQNKQ
jgi:RHS repeat-associated protein